MRGRTREPLANSSVTASTSTPTCIGRQQFGDKPTPSPPWTNRLIQWSLQESCNKERIRACAQVIQNKLVMERETGLEPATSSLGSWHSTTELLPLVERLQADSNRSVQELTLPHGAAACVA